ncbi:hypothetical protein HPP92_017360 [Vanilla planifolia]|uniref:CCHC-type domain-containing protein n=1 Tax=Vanilla planifolia TaxID=51239 RepID=A0A835QCM6_VANPL|nr:hypothetical protein HPP92_017360 [Vanilla planifolia]
MAGTKAKKSNKKPKHGVSSSPARADVHNDGCDACVAEGSDGKIDMSTDSGECSSNAATMSRVAASCRDEGESTHFADVVTLGGSNVLPGDEGLAHDVVRDGACGESCKEARDEDVMVMPRGCSSDPCRDMPMQFDVHDAATQRQDAVIGVVNNAETMPKVSFKDALTANNNASMGGVMSLVRPALIDIKDRAASTPSYLVDDAIIMSAEASMRRRDFHQHDLVGRVFGNSLPFHVIVRLLMRRWGHLKNFRILDLSAGCFCLHFESTEDRNSIWLNGPWQVAGQAMGLDVWTPNFRPSTNSAMHAPVWVRFPALPLLYWDTENIIRIAKSIGDPILLDGWTGDLQRSTYARVCVRMDLSKPLKPGMWLTGDLGRTFQPFKYEGLPQLCFSCGRVGHHSHQCNNGVAQPARSTPRPMPSVAAAGMSVPVALTVHDAGSLQAQVRSSQPAPSRVQVHASVSSGASAHAPVPSVCAGVSVPAVSNMPNESVIPAQMGCDVVELTDNLVKEMPPSTVTQDCLNNDDGAMRESLCPWMIVQPRRRNQPAAVRRGQVIRPDALASRVVPRRPGSFDGRGRHNSRRSVTTVRGRETTRRCRVRETSTDRGYNAETSRIAQVGNGTNAVSVDIKGKAIMPDDNQDGVGDTVHYVTQHVRY